MKPEFLIRKEKGSEMHLISMFASVDLYSVISLNQGGGEKKSIAGFRMFASSPNWDINRVW